MYPADKRGNDALLRNRPTLAFGESLPQIREIRERLHRLHIFRFELAAERFEIELRFQMMHAGLVKRIAVERAPQANRAELFAREPGHRG